ncbi:hypothetical protein 1 [Wuhan spider virus 8]|uniref:hypothetical protein 1 n=1 Tax=Wuhan spider virus 8 TaxID=1923757 RepID=UPI00090C4347|nr:hypothetical protein 1 [Wuhan spider virus 8]APG76393.1 hypothetical protein 1 [Wuhan spider virus 8]
MPAASFMERIEYNITAAVTSAVLQSLGFVAPGTSSTPATSAAAAPPAPAKVVKTKKTPPKAAPVKAAAPPAPVKAAAPPAPEAEVDERKQTAKQAKKAAKQAKKAAKGELLNKAQQEQEKSASSHQEKPETEASAKTRLRREQRKKQKKSKKPAKQEGFTPAKPDKKGKGKKKATPETAGFVPLGESGAKREKKFGKADATHYKMGWTKEEQTKASSAFRCDLACVRCNYATGNEICNNCRKFIKLVCCSVEKPNEAHAKWVAGGKLGEEPPATYIGAAERRVERSRGRMRVVCSGCDTPIVDWPRFMLGWQHAEAPSVRIIMCKRKACREPAAAGWLNPGSSFSPKQVEEGPVIATADELRGISKKEESKPHTRGNPRLQDFLSENQFAALEEASAAAGAKGPRVTPKRPKKARQSVEAGSQTTEPDLRNYISLDAVRTAIETGDLERLYLEAATHAALSAAKASVDAGTQTEVPHKHSVACGPDAEQSETPAAQDSVASDVAPSPSTSFAQAVRGATASTSAAPQDKGVGQTPEKQQPKASKSSKPWPKDKPVALAVGMSTLDWVEDGIQELKGKFDKPHGPKARGVLLFSDVPRTYSYSGVKLSPREKLPWMVSLERLALKYLKEEGGLDVKPTDFGMLVVNDYGKDQGIPEHSDNERDIDQDRPIISLSVGGKRLMTFTDLKGEVVEEVPLASWDLVVMPPGSQKLFHHKVDGEGGPRTNFTWRAWKSAGRPHPR